MSSGCGYCLELLGFGVLGVGNLTAVPSSTQQNSFNVALRRRPLTFYIVAACGKFAGILERSDLSR
jgi:hypothetical protein